MTTLATPQTTLQVWTVQRVSGFFGTYNICFFKTKAEAVSYMEKDGHKNLKIVAKDGVYNGPIMLQTAKQFHTY
tara:strand:- start:1521 stop:1742 length:222 start_codon:yes stop_codon:yes gene_type:complete